MFDPLTVSLRRLCRIGKCPGRRPRHLSGLLEWLSWVRLDRRLSERLWRTGAPALKADRSRDDD
jgi:hypothetical protein